MLRQLDQRTTDGLTVTLLWDSEADIVLLWCENERTSAGAFRCVVEPSEARMAFLNPVALQRATARQSGSTPPTTSLAPLPPGREADPYGEIVVVPFDGYEAGGFAAEIPCHDNECPGAFLYTLWLLCVVFVIITLVLPG